MGKGKTEEISNLLHSQKIDMGILCPNFKTGFASSTDKPAHQEGCVSQAPESASSGNVTITAKVCSLLWLNPPLSPFNMQGLGGIIKTFTDSKKPTQTIFFLPLQHMNGLAKLSLMPEHRNGHEHRHGGS